MQYKKVILFINYILALYLFDIKEFQIKTKREEDQDIFIEFNMQIIHCIKDYILNRNTLNYLWSTQNKFFSIFYYVTKDGYDNDEFDS